MSKQKGHKLSFKGVSKMYGSAYALHPTDLEVHPGEIFAVIGPSGSGKTTLLNLTAGYATPSTGSIEVDGVSIEKKPPYKRDIGMVFQGYSLFPHMTVAENIAFPLRVRREPKSEIGRRVGEMIDLVRLQGMADRFPAALSGGQQQRVALARAAVYNPLLLLMDEPLSALDKNLRDQMQNEIKQFHQSVGSTYIYVTHDQGEAASLADRMAIMADGRIQQIGTARSLYEAPRNRFVATFLGHANIFDVSEARREAAGIIVRTHSDAEIRIAGVPDIPLDSICCCVRPESLIVSSGKVVADNVMAGVLYDATFINGVLHRKVRIDNGPEIIEQSSAKLASIQIGERVQVGWSADDTLLLQN